MSVPDFTRRTTSMNTRDEILIAIGRIEGKLEAFASLSQRVSTLERWQAGQLPASAKPALAALIRAYNAARASWLAYRGAFATNVPSQQYLDQWTKNLTDLSAAIRGFEEAMK